MPRGHCTHALQQGRGLSHGTWRVVRRLFKSLKLSWGGLALKSRFTPDQDEVLVRESSASSARGTWAARNWGSLVLTNKRLSWRDFIVPYSLDLDVPLSDIVDVEPGGFWGQLAFGGPYIAVRLRSGKLLRFGFEFSYREKPQEWVTALRQLRSSEMS